MQVIEVEAFGDSDTIATAERERPEPGPGQVRIAVEAAGINFADVMQRRGEYPGGPEPPYVPGMEVAGTVDAVGADVDRSEGEQVVAMVTGGGYAEYAVADAVALMDVPEGMGMAEAAGFPVQFLTAHNVLFEWGGLEADESVLVHAAAGGVGTAAVQLAARAGAEVFGTASTAAKLDHATSMGVDHPINYTEEDFREVVEEHTDGGVDLVLDGVGGDVHYRSLDALAQLGRLVTYGVASGEVARPDTSQLLFNNHTVIGYHLGRALEHAPSKVLEALGPLTEGLASGDLEVVVGERFPLEEARAAHEYIENRESRGKVVLEP